jgi:hypothetical protein
MYKNTISTIRKQRKTIVNISSYNPNVPNSIFIHSNRIVLDYTRTTRTTIYLNIFLNFHLFVFLMKPQQKFMGLKLIK